MPRSTQTPSLASEEQPLVVAQEHNGNVGDSFSPEVAMENFFSIGDIHNDSDGKAMLRFNEAAEYLYAYLKQVDEMDKETDEPHARMLALANEAFEVLNSDNTTVVNILRIQMILRLLEDDAFESVDKQVLIEGSELFALPEMENWWNLYPSNCDDQGTVNVNVMTVNMLMQRLWPHIKTAENETLESFIARNLLERMNDCAYDLRIFGYFVDEGLKGDIKKVVKNEEPSVTVDAARFSPVAYKGWKKLYKEMGAAVYAHVADAIFSLGKSESSVDVLIGYQAARFFHHSVHSNEIAPAAMAMADRALSRSHDEIDRLMPHVTKSEDVQANNDKGTE